VRRLLEEVLYRQRRMEDRLSEPSPSEGTTPSFERQLERRSSGP
jgi:hypothetical protein